MLGRIVRESHPTVLALVGAGGSGKTTLAAALGHRMKRRFAGRVAWLRIGAWDVSTVVQMMAMELGLPPRTGVPLLRRRLRAAGPSLIVLDNHESDLVTATVLDALRDTPVSWIVTARRCLLGGVTPFPVVAPLVARRAHPFPSIAPMTRLLRWHAVALDVADALVTSGAVDVATLEARLRARGIGRIRPVEHEDDVPEVKGVVHEAFATLGPSARRMLGVLCAMGGDHLGVDWLVRLARARDGARALASLRSVRLVQEPIAGRLTLHATVRHALGPLVACDRDALSLELLALLEAHPDRARLEQTHLYALMDWAQERAELALILRVQDLAAR